MVIEEAAITIWEIYNKVPAEYKGLFISALFKKAYGRLLKGRGKEFLAEILFKLSPKKIVLIGGGEIGLEIAARAYNRRINPFCIDEDRYVPMLNLGRLVQKSVDIHNHYERIQSISSSINAVKDVINSKKPNYVILEKNFLGMNEWRKIYEKTKQKDNFIFLPNPKNISYLSCIDKLKTKIWLEKEFNNKKIILPYKEVKIEKGTEEIKKFFDEYKNIVLKPRVSSNGRVYSEISDKKHINDSFKAAKKLTRYKNVDSIIVEKKINNYFELYVMAFNCPGSSINVIAPIQYEKESEPSDKIGGPYLLKWSRFPAKDLIPKGITKEINEIMVKICKKTESPFIGVEFFIEGDNLYINEITWRPEDAGFVTLMSHSPDQFTAFINCLQSIYDSNIKVDMEEKVKGKSYMCKPIRRKIRISEENPFPDRAYYPGIPSDYTIRLFEKELNDVDIRTIGYFVFDEILGEKEADEILESSLDEFVGHDKNTRDLYIF